MWRREDLEKTRSTSGTGTSSRGAGFCPWKPYIILAGLQQLKEDHFLIYCDSGKLANPQRITPPLAALTEWRQANSNGMLSRVYIPERARIPDGRRANASASWIAKGLLPGSSPDPGNFSVGQKHGRP